VKHPDYPGVTSYKDRHGKTRWQFRKTGLRRAYLPGEPHTPAFDAAYQAAIEGRAKTKAEMIRHPRAAYPESLNQCWFKVRERPKFQKLDPATRYQYTYLIEAWLDEPVGDGMKRGDGPVADLRPRHIQDSLDRLSASNSTILKVMIRKLMKEARLQDWIEFDPTYGTEVVERDSEGLKAWPPEFCAKYEAIHPVGSPARTAYELARWLGIRRSDIALLRWDQIVTKIVDGEPVDGFLFTPFKGRRRKGAYAKFHPISPMLAEALAPLDRSTGTVLVSSAGKPYRMETVSQRMWEDWLPQAGIPRGYGLHGLRKAMGGILVDAGANLHESRDVLGHATYKEVELYNRSRDQASAATRGNRKVVKLVRG
jgi:integrase